MEPEDLIDMLFDQGGFCFSGTPTGGRQRPKRGKHWRTQRPPFDVELRNLANRHRFMIGQYLFLQICGAGWLFDSVATSTDTRVDLGAQVIAASAECGHAFPETVLDVVTSARHGQLSYVDSGHLYQGERVLLVSDFSLSPDRLLDDAHAIRDANMEVAGVVMMLDDGHHIEPSLRFSQIPFLAAFTLVEVLVKLREMYLISPSLQQKVGQQFAHMAH